MTKCLRCGRNIKYLHYANDGSGPYGSVCVMKEINYEGTLFPYEYECQDMTFCRAGISSDKRTEIMRIKKNSDTYNYRSIVNIS